MNAPTRMCRVQKRTLTLHLISKLNLKLGLQLTTPNILLSSAQHWGYLFN